VVQNYLDENGSLMFPKSFLKALLAVKLKRNHRYALLERAKVKRIRTLREKLMINEPKDSPPKFQPSVRNKSARIKTRAEKYNGYDLRCVPFQP
jgi:hypothetical protein